MNALKMGLIPASGDLKIGGPARNAKARDRFDESGPTAAGARRGGMSANTAIGSVEDVIFSRMCATV
jgi:hypothetical protein